jgi:hypothetical protein
MKGSMEESPRRIGDRMGRVNRLAKVAAEHVILDPEHPEEKDARKRLIEEFYSARGITPNQVTLEEHMANLEEVMATAEWQDPLGLTKTQ